jgi:hypothetical protein
MYFLFNRTTLQVFVTYRTGALYVQPLWFQKHQHDNRVRSTQNVFLLRFAAILVNCAPSGEMNNYCTQHIMKENVTFFTHRCNYIILSQVYCVWQVVKTLTIIFNNRLFSLGTSVYQIPASMNYFKSYIEMWHNMTYYWNVYTWSTKSISSEYLFNHKHLVQYDSVTGSVKHTQ